MRTIFDDIALVISELDDSWLFDSIDACERLDVLQQQFTALAPDWAEAPEWAMWYTINANGRGVFWGSEPACDEWTWDLPTVTFMYSAIAELPLGIDWRLCKWQRPAVQP